MSDQINRQQRYRQNPVSIEQVNTLINETQRTFKQGDVPYLTAAVVFSFGKEFAFVPNQKDTALMLEYGDPVGVVGIFGRKIGEEAPQPIFTTFKGHEWAEEHAAEIIKHAEAIIDAYVYA
jgi:hypothetical protein